ncbi:nicotinate mononucleotide-dependent phosphoribosyltransferase CobT [Synechocystis sp. LKSZ1]|uniref:nicotinate mononucleotide-dependent phosphoribosyltransferase CobT n=1 Tax=Synechocystis sp. LKSZ1 TaxID=3144951 RepID=UPI00336BC54C
MLTVYTQFEQGQAWIQRYRHRRPLLACLLGFTETGLIPGISAAGLTPQDRQYTAVADAEFLVQGCQAAPQYPLPPLSVGVSPVFITRAVVEACQIPVQVFNTGLPITPSIPTIDLGGQPAGCVSTGQALPLGLVQHLFQQGLAWGETLAQRYPDSYLVLSECVVGGTTTALALLTALGIAANGKVNSSHPACNHAQKWAIVQQGLQYLKDVYDPFALVAAVGDPMQITCAGMAIAASCSSGVLLAGGTQMLAVYALIQALANHRSLVLDWDQIVVGTTRWVAEDPTGDTIGLAQALAPVPLLGTQLNFRDSRYPQLQRYEQGFVKEGVGAGGAAIVAHLYQDWNQAQLLGSIEALLDKYYALRTSDE